MKRWLKFAAVIWVLANSALTLRAGQLLEQIVATVNSHIILLSDWDDEVRCEALMNGKALDQVTLDDRKAALDHLIDQELLREQVGGAEVSPANEADVSKQLQQIKSLYDAKENPDAWPQALARYKVTEQQLRKRISLE